MSLSANQIYETALTLPQEEREELATRLFDSLEESPEELGPEWDAEI